MKQRITLEQLNELAQHQKERLNSLWIPEKYDLAVATVCTDAINEKYEQIKFVVGEIGVYEMSNYKVSVTLWDLESLKRNQGDEENMDIDEEFSEDSYFDDDSSQLGEWNEEEENELEFDYKYEKPSSFSKEECMPVLNIGQMLKILKSLNYGDGKFYIDIQSNNKFGIGRDIYQHDFYGNEYEEAELCDILWDQIKQLI